MKTLTIGHKYELDSLEGTNPQILQFIEKENKNNKLITINDGTTNEEVLKMLIDRMKVLGEKLPCRENSMAVTKLEEALLWLEYRTQKRKLQNVESTPFAHKN